MYLKYFNSRKGVFTFKILENVLNTEYSNREFKNKIQSQTQMYKEINIYQIVKHILAGTAYTIRRPNKSCPSVFLTVAAAC